MFKGKTHKFTENFCIVCKKKKQYVYMLPSGIINWIG